MKESYMDMGIHLMDRLKSLLMFARNGRLSR
jgi:hypothetical protein